MHSDDKKRRSYLALLFPAGDLRHYQHKFSKSDEAGSVNLGFFFISKGYELPWIKYHP